MASEFELIARYFTRPVRHAVLGVGDDAALVESTPGKQLAVTTDTMVAGTHFFVDTQARPLGHKALAVNLSDLAAMGARPLYALLALTLPKADETWVAEFADGFYRLADSHDVELIGGGTTPRPPFFPGAAPRRAAPGKNRRSAWWGKRENFGVARSLKKKTKNSR